LILTQPESLTKNHDLTEFSCGVASLDIWLQKRALSNQIRDASRSFVVCDGDNKVVAYYSLAAGGIASNEAIGRFKRNMPNPIPVAILARLAIDQSWQGKGLGRGLFQDAVRRIITEGAADTLGIRGLITHAISPEAKEFYLSLGFDPSPSDPMTLMVTLADLRKAVTG